jgi:predicted molibdopterin-dependent oxidoreductase YjgC
LKRVINLGGVSRWLSSACFDAGKAALLVARVAFGVSAWAEGQTAAQFQQLQQLPTEKAQARVEYMLKNGKLLRNWVSNQFRRRRAEDLTSQVMVVDLHSSFESASGWSVVEGMLESAPLRAMLGAIILA